MKNIIIPSLLMFAFLGGCASVSTDSSQDSTKANSDYLNKDQVITHVSGNTEKWTKGAGYYVANGNLIGIWDGENVEGTWSVRDSGEICLTVLSWGEEDCHRYKNENGDVMLSYKGKSSQREIKQGNQLDAF